MPGDAVAAVLLDGFGDRPRIHLAHLRNLDPFKGSEEGRSPGVARGLLSLTGLLIERSEFSAQRFASCCNRGEVERLRLEVERDLKATEARLVTWVVGQGAATIGILFALQHFVGK